MLRLRWFLAGMIAGAFGLYAHQVTKEARELLSMQRAITARLVRISNPPADITRDSGSVRPLSELGQ